jgi:hypothetical protein
MVTMPDGMELFSRFDDPRFSRPFWKVDERSEILLQFRRSKKGAEKKGHLLSVLA